jgi:hypothetical protein
MTLSITATVVRINGAPVHLTLTHPIELGWAAQQERH